MSSADDFQEMREMLKEILILQSQHEQVLLKRPEILVAHEERMERVGRHLEVLADITDSLIRDKADRKKR